MKNSVDDLRIEMINYYSTQRFRNSRLDHSKHRVRPKIKDQTTLSINPRDESKPESRHESNLKPSCGEIDEENVRRDYSNTTKTKKKALSLNDLNRFRRQKIQLYSRRKIEKKKKKTARRQLFFDDTICFKENKRNKKKFSKFQKRRSSGFMNLPKNSDFANRKRDNPKIRTEK